MDPWEQISVNFNQHTIIFITKMRLTLSSVKWRPFCLGLNVFNSIRTSNSRCTSELLGIDCKYSVESQRECIATINSKLFFIAYEAVTFLFVSHNGAIASQITSLTIVYSTVYSGTDERKHQSSAPLAFVRGIQQWPVNSPHKEPVTRKMFPFDDVIMIPRSTRITHRSDTFCVIWQRDPNIK